MTRGSKSGIERRRHSRTNVCSNVRLSRGGYSFSGSLINISIGGLLAEAEIVLQRGDEDRIITPDAQVVIDIPKLRLAGLTGKILRVHSAGIGSSIAVQFDQLRHEVAERLIARIVGRR